MELNRYKSSHFRLVISQSDSAGQKRLSFVCCVTRCSHRLRHRRHLRRHRHRHRHRRRRHRHRHFCHHECLFFVILVFGFRNNLSEGQTVEFVSPTDAHSSTLTQHFWGERGITRTLRGQHSCLEQKLFLEILHLCQERHPLDIQRTVFITGT